MNCVQCNKRLQKSFHSLDQTKKDGGNGWDLGKEKNLFDCCDLVNVSVSEFSNCLLILRHCIVLLQGECSYHGSARGGDYREAADGGTEGQTEGPH